MLIDSEEEYIELAHNVIEPAKILYDKKIKRNVLTGDYTIFESKLEALLKCAYFGYNDIKKITYYINKIEENYKYIEFFTDYHNKDELTEFCLRCN